MTASALLPAFVAPLFAERRATFAASAPRDLTDPASFPDLLGIVCRLHARPRFLTEVPLVPCPEQTETFCQIKRQAFPNSWTGVTSYLPATRGSRRTRMVVVRYCPECREAAGQFFADEALA